MPPGSAGCQGTKGGRIPLEDADPAWCDGCRDEVFLTLLRRILISAVLAAAVGAAIAILLVYFSRESFFLGGIQVNEPDHEVWFEALERSGMNTVSTTVYAKQGDWDTAHLWWEEEEPAVVREIRGAKERGLHVVLIPRVALDHAFERNRFLWHGMILPSNDDGIDAWFALYREFVLKWATLAEREDVDVFAVGSELSSLTSTIPVDAVPGLERWYLDAERQEERKRVLLGLEQKIASRYLYARGDYGFDSLDGYLDAEIRTHREWAESVTWGGGERAVERINRRRARLLGHWRELIAGVRQVYRGRLTYAANFDQYREVAFWPDLDLIGINAYFPLRDVTRPAGTPEDLRIALLEGWRTILGDLDAFRHERGIGGMEVLFTEIGYARHVGSTLEPWNGTGFSLVYADERHELWVWGDQPVDLGERAAAIRALHDAHQELERPLLRGLLYWKLSTIPSHREIEPFVQILGSDDPALEELRRFR
jgi:hypothetical protein